MMNHDTSYIAWKPNNHRHSFLTQYHHNELSKIIGKIFYGIKNVVNKICDEMNTSLITWGSLVTNATNTNYPIIATRIVQSCIEI